MVTGEPAKRCRTSSEQNDLRKIMWKSYLKTISTNNYRVLPSFVDKPRGILFEYLNLIFAISLSISLLKKTNRLKTTKRNQTKDRPFGFHHSNSTLWPVNNDPWIGRAIQAANAACLPSLSLSLFAADDEFSKASFSNELQRMLQSEVWVAS